MYMEAASCQEMSVTIYQSIWCCVPENFYLQKAFVMSLLTSSNKAEGYGRSPSHNMICTALVLVE
jgi:hypothetical protein